MTYLIIVWLIMNRLKTIKKYFRDTMLEKTFVDILSKVQLFNMSIKQIILEMKNEELMKLQLFYNTTNFNRLVEKLQNDIEYILELE